MPTDIIEHIHARRTPILMMDVALLALNLDVLSLAMIQSITKAHLLENYS